MTQTTTKTWNVSYTWIIVKDGSVLYEGVNRLDCELNNFFGGIILHASDAWIERNTK
jgi:hypothetical protein